MSGSDTGTIRELLGHTTDRMTQRYAHATPGYRHDAVQRLARTPEPTNEVAPVVAPSVADEGGAEADGSGAEAASRVSTRVGG